MHTITKISSPSTPFAFGRFAIIFLLLIFYAWALVDVYDFQIMGANPGMQPWEMTSMAATCCVVGLVLIAALLAQMRGEPSDFFLIFYLSIVATSYLTLHSVLGRVSDEHFLMFLGIIVLPIFCINIFRTLLPGLRFAGFLSPGLIHGLVVALVLVSVVGGYLNSPSTAGFGIDDSHLRLSLIHI